MTNKDIIYDEQRKLVIARFKTLQSHAKLMLGNGENLSVGDLISHVEKDDDLGKKIVQVQINMLRILMGGEI
ncbi:MAG: hypothetical protein AABX47_09120 [Nanoarchaeota archaeon]